MKSQKIDLLCILTKPLIHIMQYKVLNIKSEECTIKNNYIIYSYISYDNFVLLCVIIQAQVSLN